LRSKVVEISESLRALFRGKVWEDGNAGHGLGRRSSFVPARTSIAWETARSFSIHEVTHKLMNLNDPVRPDQRALRP